MKKFLTVSALAAACACSVVPAFADAVYGGPVGVSLRIGGFYPTETDTQHNIGNTWFAAGFDYKLNGIKVPLLPPGYFSVSIDYAGRGDYRTAPLLFNYTSGKTLYWSAGAGVTFSKFPQDDGTENNQIRFAYSGALGWNFSKGDIPLFIEARYLGSEMPRVAGLAFYVGARF